MILQPPNPRWRNGVPRFPFPLAHALADGTLRIIRMLSFRSIPARAFPLLGMLWGLTTAGEARADASAVPAGPRPHTHAIIVGSNVGGAGQNSLKFAESDAEQMATVLREVGHVEATRTRVLLHPSS